jgi:hypothetical protein
VPFTTSFLGPGGHGGFGFGGEGLGGDGDGLGGEGLGGDGFGGLGGMGGDGLGGMGGAGPWWKHFSQHIFMHSIFSLLSVSGHTKSSARTQSEKKEN